MDKLRLENFKELSEYLKKYKLSAEIYGKHNKIAELHIDGDKKPFSVLENLLKSLGKEQDLLYVVEETKEVKEVKTTKFKKRGK